jgi:hypothetical protein
MPSDPAQTLITEQQVLFSTAAATALPPVRARRFGDAVRRVVGPRYPKRHVWLENSLMSREMDRL